MAERVRFIRDYDYRVPGGTTDLAYKAGMEVLVPQAHAVAASAAGACVVLPREDAAGKAKQARAKGEAP